MHACVPQEILAQGPVFSALETMKLTNAVLAAVLAAEAPNPKTDALAAKGPSAIAAALEQELAEAEAVGDKEHVASIKKHFADYLSERKERIEDAP